APDLNLRIARYEDMRLDPLFTFTAIAEFLCLPHDQHKVEDALTKCDFSLLKEQEEQGNFKERPANAPCFFRKGLVGDWQDQLTEEQVERIIKGHGQVMRRFGYLDSAGQPLHPPRPLAKNSVQMEHGAPCFYDPH
ncbi:MAG: hypothetical protein D3916_10830, partial [Candidatus Electrothrix sp. MAN1_4]|nr:hypothetical protein [Candidatus Electrothrix sp. MAN1_4]